MTNLHDTATAWWDTGALPLPLAPDGSKRPAVTAWKQLQDPAQRPTATQLQHLWHADTDGIGVICGAASGQLEMLEAEAAAITTGLIPQLEQAFTDHGRQDLWTRLHGGYVEITPSGGLHWYLRTTDGPALGNTKLARRRNPDTGQIQVLFETRGEGGWTVIAPSAGRSHPTGKAWTTITGTPQSIPVFTCAERDFIHDMCRLLDELDDGTTGAAPVAAVSTAVDGVLRPGDDYNQRADWPQLLEPRGWKIVSQRGQLRTWRHPNTDSLMSATSGRTPENRLFVFSTSTEFEAEKPYDLFGAYALLEHGGDLAAATRALSQQGYGDPPEPIRLTLTGQPLPAPAAPVSDGTAALATIHQLRPATAAVEVEDNEDALAQALLTETADVLRYCPQRNRWLHWTGARWEWDDAEYHRETIKQVARRLPRDGKAAAFRRKMLSSAGVGGVARLARTDPRVVVHVDDLDGNPHELNTPDGIVNLRTGQLLPPDPTKLHTRSTAVAPNPNQDAPLWTGFLATTFGDDQAMIGYVQRIMGLAAIGEVTHHILPFGVGVGANGKSVFVDTCAGVLGRGERGYAISANAEMLMVRRYQEHATELAQLAGARLVICSEVDDDARFAEARVKQLVGGDSISARFMGRDYFTFTPSHLFFLVANQKPQAAVGGLSFWRRLRLIPFNHVVPETARDPHLPEKLRAEWPAILAWIIQGAVDVLAGGLQTPPGVTEATADYERGEDTLQRFVEEECHRAASDLVRIRTSELRAAYEAMCRETGDVPISARRFAQELRDRFGIQSFKSHGQRYSLGITLIKTDDDPGNEPPYEPEGLL